MLSVDVLTLFPRMVAAPLAESILGKAQERGHLRARVTDIRDFAEGRHRVTDDTPYGGGAGMVLKPEPLVAAIEAARARLAAELDAETGGAASAAAPAPRVILLCPQGAVFDQAAAVRLSQIRRLVLVCGRYEGVDERVRAHVDEELSLGDFVMTGGEIAALAVIDAVARLVPGVLGNDASAQSESFAAEAREDAGLLLEGPQYTRPPSFRGQEVPAALLSGDHARIVRWRRQQALLRTRSRRPDLFARLKLSAADRRLLAEAPHASPAASLPASLRASNVQKPVDSETSCGMGLPSIG